MSGSYRDVIAALFGCLAVALIGGAFALGMGIGSYQSAEEERHSWVTDKHQAITASTDYQAYRQNGVPQRPPFPTTIDGKNISEAECADSKDCRSEQRDYSDLQAQWRAAMAAEGQYTLAWGVIILSAVGTVLAAIGTVFVIGAYRENKRSADAAHDANRPWLEIDARAVKLVVEEIGVRVHLDCVVTNRGNSPATDVLIYGKLVAAAHGFEDSASITKSIRNILDKWCHATSELGISIFPAGPKNLPGRAKLTPQELAAARGVPPVGVFYSVGIGVKYCFGGRAGQTVNTYDIFISGPRFDYDDLPIVIGDDRLVLRPGLGAYAI